MAGIAPESIERLPYDVVVVGAGGSGLRAAIEAKDAKAAKEALKAATIAIDKASSKGVIAKETASRTVSRLSAQVHKLGA